MSATGRNFTAGGRTADLVWPLSLSIPIGDATSTTANQVVGSTSNGLSYQDMLMVFNGTSWDRLRTPTVFKTVNVLAVGAEATIWTPGAGKKFRLMGFALALSSAAVLTLKDNTAGTTIYVGLLAAAGPNLVVDLGNGILSAVANNVLTATSSVAGNLTGTVWGTEE